MTKNTFAAEVTFREKVKSVNYPCDYIGDSKKISTDLLGESIEEDEEEAEVCETSECDRD